MQLRHLALAKQGLAAHSKFGLGLAGTRKAIEHLGYVQIDTLSVVERAHHHVLWTRVPDYDPSFLNQLISNKQIFEHWYHAASYLPMRDYRFVLPNMNSIRNGENRFYNNIDQHLMGEILARIKDEGPLRLRGLDKGNKAIGSWWNWGPGKRAVERLFMQGDLMVSSRVGMEKVYDLTERCLPEGINLSLPSLHEYAEYLFDTTVRAHGVFTWKQLLHLKTGKPMRDAMLKVLNERIESGAVTILTNVDAPHTYVETRVLDSISSFNPAVKILSPFDNVLIHRERLSAVFNFNYTIECYVPVAKRKFGYFCLPILYNQEFIGRIDCKAHRSEQRLEVLSLHIECRSLDEDLFFPALGQALKKFAKFNKCARLDVSKIDCPL